LNPRVARFKLARAALACNRFPTKALFQAFGTPESILAASRGRLREIPGLDPAVLHHLLSERDDMFAPETPGPPEEAGLRLLSFEDPDYPPNLREIPDPPAVLFARGRIPARDGKAVAVIGSRGASAYGIAVCGRLARSLVDYGFSIVSGMAKGVDAAAHWAALDRGGTTVAVLGTGVDVIYPKGNRQLFERILERGVLLSEFLPGTQALAKNFPRRNRIISGMCLGVLVVEAAERSGTMITVRTALEQGREVFAVPGDIRSPLSRGTHQLIRNGAKLVERVEDILEEFLGSGQGTVPADAKGSGNDPLRTPCRDRAAREPREGERETLLGNLSDEGTSVDVLIERTGWPSERIATLLTELELLGKVTRMPGGRYLRSREGA
jgi:DNA processing protein